MVAAFSQRARRTATARSAPRSPDATWTETVPWSCPWGSGTAVEIEVVVFDLELELDEIGQGVSETR